ncbi:MAG: type IV toxin-antitoxin system AbiEi family antitoxin domain-containing protein [Sedimentisphaerales bacterium]|nr:type IV toxin-antitoxin system AbiEi family antitoxin domain-containing protein [Sedimentisphaerales bacterium]
MIQSLDELLAAAKDRLLLEHRTGNVELKRSWDQENGKKISAFANRLGAAVQWMCIGIADDGSLCGRTESWAKSTEEAVSQHLNQYLDPQTTCEAISCHAVNGQWVVAIKFRSPGSVVYWNNVAYKAAGTTIVSMTPEEIMQLTIALPGLTDYSAQRWAGVSDDRKVTEYINCVAHRRSGTTLESIAGLQPSEALERIGIRGTNSERVLFGDIHYRVVKYDRGGNPLSNETFTGLHDLISSRFHQEVQDWSRNALGIRSQPYPERALKEGLANAIAHAAYFEADGDIIVEVFPDRLCISNLCQKESGYFANKWFSRAHKTMNRLLMEALRLAGSVDELGRGKTLIFSDALRSGKRPPEVFLERGRRYDRWRLIIHGGERDNVQLRVFERLRQIYPDEHKALIAHALVLWRGQTVSQIRQYVDGESSRAFAEVLADLRGPIFYYQKRDQIVLRRWVTVLLGEGKDSKKLSPAEEEDLFEFLRKLHTEYHRGYITSKELREAAGMGHSQSEIVLGSQIFRKWAEEGKVAKVKKGVYRFVQPLTSLAREDLFEFILNELSKGPEPGRNAQQTVRSDSGTRAADGTASGLPQP